MVVKKPHIYIDTYRTYIHRYIPDIYTSTHIGHIYIDTYRTYIHRHIPDIYTSIHTGHIYIDTYRTYIHRHIPDIYTSTHTGQSGLVITNTSPCPGPMHIYPTSVCALMQLPVSTLSAGAGGECYSGACEQTTHTSVQHHRESCSDH